MAELGFKELCKEMKSFFGVSSLEKVAKELGYKESAAVGWRGRKAFSENAILRYEFLKSQATEPKNQTSETSDTIQIPIYDVLASAGEGAINDERVIEYISISKIMLKTFFNLSHTQNLSIITARGDSMEPTIPQGSQILVQQREVLDGEVCVCRIGEELYVKRLQKLPRFVLLSDNPRYEAIPLTSRDFEIIGAVVGVFIKFGAR